ncbi:hypothetical protein IAE37_000871 [Pseudomonas sp. S31]|uniref:hypothetical protein n=1 Tax=Pseudomonas sp. S31 TaxID=1564473 RepID=UPI0019148D7D|nr:hypothetical protein [Pseudomonas sp. S31]MBK4998595.1 hypothetical protein [Pseudomonas sp. S31]
MFRTNVTDMVGIPGMFGEGQCNWNQVSRILRTHWYHLTLQHYQEGRTYEATLMVDSEPRLQEILLGQDDDLKVTDVLVVTPSHMNGTTGWRMETLVEATLGEDENECSVCLLEVENGAVYHSSHVAGFDPDSLKNLYPIYRASMIR